MHLAWTAPSVAPGPFDTWFNVTAVQDDSGKGRATITIQAPANSRTCRLYFEDDTPATSVHVEGGSPASESLYPLPPGGVGEMRLWSREWANQFTVKVEWDAQDGERPLKGRASCLWHEEAGVEAYAEIRAFLPRWVLVSTKGSGLLEASKAFEAH